MSPEDKLSQRLVEDITWRLRELSELVRACSDGSEIRRNALSRAVLPLLYAHWEGYFVVSANAYLNFLTEKRVQISSLKDEFWTLSVRRRFKSNQIGGDISFSKFLMSIKGEPDRIFKKGSFDKINGSSNLKSDVVIFCCESVGIDPGNFKEYFEFIDGELISKRNFVAHGQALRFEDTQVPIYREKVVDLMRICQSQFENAAYTQAYLR